MKSRGKRRFYFPPGCTIISISTAASRGHFLPRSRRENERSRKLQGSQNSRHRKRDRPPDRENPEAPSGLPARTGPSESPHRSEFVARGNARLLESPLALWTTGGPGESSQPNRGHQGCV